MIDYEKVKEKLDKWQDYNYSSDHLNVRIRLYNWDGVETTVQVKGTDLSYTLKCNDWDWAIDVIQKQLKQILKEIKRDLKKELEM